jgi:hypothetical protein
VINELTNVTQFIRQSTEGRSVCPTPEYESAAENGAERALILGGAERDVIKRVEREIGERNSNKLVERGAASYSPLRSHALAHTREQRTIETLAGNPAGQPALQHKATLRLLCN